MATGGAAGDTAARTHAYGAGGSGVAETRTAARTVQQRARTRTGAGGGGEDGGMHGAAARTAARTWPQARGLDLPLPPALLSSSTHRPIHAEFRVVVGVSSGPNLRWWLIDPACWSSSLLGGSSIPRRISRRVPTWSPAPAPLSRQNEDASTDLNGHREIEVKKIHRDQNSVSHVLATRGRRDALTAFWPDDSCNFITHLCTKGEIKKRRRCDRIDRQKKVVPAKPRWRRLWAMLSLSRLAASERTGVSGEISSSTSSYRSFGSSSSPRVSQMLWRTQQAPSTTGRSWSFTSVRASGGTPTAP
uniref:Uncharacterized protein n=1 Tax=Oryza meridionalis TaxID=40149 RepID=A0A0E0FCW8_9ORYZ